MENAINLFLFSIKTFPKYKVENSFISFWYEVERCNRDILLFILPLWIYYFLIFSIFLLIFFYWNSIVVTRNLIPANGNLFLWQQVTGKLFLLQPFYSFGRISILSKRNFFLSQQFFLLTGNSFLWQSFMLVMFIVNFGIVLTWSV